MTPVQQINVCKVFHSIRVTETKEYFLSLFNFTVRASCSLKVMPLRLG